MNVVTWLHVSDWHHGNKGNLNRMVVRDALIEDIRNRAALCDKSLEHLDFVIFSGDLAFRGTEGEYKAAEIEFLEPLRKAAGVGLERFILVPGNHDLDRGVLVDLPKMLSRFRTRESVAEVFQDPNRRRHYLMPMAAYADFIKKYLGENAPAEPAYGFAKSVSTKNGVGVSFLGLNSAWMCGQFADPLADEINDYGRLILGEHQFRQSSNRVNDGEIRIAVMHHPFQWLSEVEQRSTLSTQLRRHCHFLLQGHEHRAAVTFPVGTAGDCGVISAAAAYDRREFPNGYNYVRVDLDRGQGTIYLRRYVDDPPRFLKDTATTGDESPGMVTFTLPKNLGKPSKKSAIASSPAATSRIVGNPWSVQSPSTMQTLAYVYDRQHQSTSIIYKLIRMVVKANSLASLSEPDEIVSEIVIQADKRPVYCHKISLMNSPGSEYLGRASWEVSSSDKQQVKAIDVPIGSESEYNQMLLFFDPVLEPGPKNYRLKLTEYEADSMKPLREGRDDELFVRVARSARRIERIELVLMVPKSFGEVEMRLSSRVGRVADGEPMTAGLPTAKGFHSLGWCASKLSQAGLFGVDVTGKGTR